MSGGPKKTPAETWDALEKMTLEDEVDRVLGMSDAEIDEELKGAGFDPKAVRERGREIGRQLEAGSPAQSPQSQSLAEDREPGSGDMGAWVSEPPPRAPTPLRGLSRRSVWLIAAVLAAAIGGGAAVAAGMLSKRETPPVNDLPDGGPSKVETPAPSDVPGLGSPGMERKPERPRK